MIRRFPSFAFIAAIALSTLCLAADDGTATDPTAPPLGKWAKHYYDRVAQFERENVAPGNVVLVGSSHIEGLDAAKWLPKWRVINRGISSDRIGISERGILHRLDCSIFDCDPAVVVIQNGANDLGELWRNGTPSIDEIDACYREVVSRIRTRLPDVPVIVVGLLPTRDKYAGLIPYLLKLEERQKQIARDLGCMFLEVYPHLADEKSELRAEYSREGLHLTQAGYEVWAALLDKALSEAVTLTATPLPTDSATREAGSDLLWYDARDLLIEGKGWTGTESFYDRLPTRAKADVTDMVWQTSRMSAGIAVRFATDSASVSAVWDGGGAMTHMAATGNSGLDLYVRRDGEWVFRSVAKPKPERTTATLVNDRVATPAEYLLYLPLYADVSDLKIGIDADATISKPALRSTRRSKPIIFYGTSITQGGCASRAGMAHPAILGRWFDREVINLGFSGSGKMEPEMALLLGELDPAVYVLECLPNMTTEMVRTRVDPFVRLLRKARPTTPVLLVESPFGGSANAGNAALRNAYIGLVADEVAHLHYLPGANLLAGRENGTVDGVHPTDLGFYRMATAYEPILSAILASQP